MFFFLRCNYVALSRSTQPFIPFTEREAKIQSKPILSDILIEINPQINMVKVMIHLLITGAKNRLQYIYMSERERERERERKKQGLKMIKEPHVEKHSQPPTPQETNKDCLRMARTGENRGCGMIS